MGSASGRQRPAKKREATSQGGLFTCPPGHSCALGPLPEGSTERSAEREYLLPLSSKSLLAPSCSPQPFQWGAGLRPEGGSWKAGHKNVALCVPQWSFLIPSLGSNSIPRSDWPTVTSLSPHLGNRISPSHPLSSFADSCDSEMTSEPFPCPPARALQLTAPRRP